MNELNAVLIIHLLLALSSLCHLFHKGMDLIGWKAAAFANLCIFPLLYIIFLNCHLKTLSTCAIPLTPTFNLECLVISTKVTYESFIVNGGRGA